MGAQNGCGGLGIGADPAGGCAQRIGRMERVAALKPHAARVAVPGVNAELADERLAGDLGLELVGRASLDNAALSVRTGARGARRVAPRDLFR